MRHYGNQSHSDLDEQALEDIEVPELDDDETPQAVQEEKISEAVGDYVRLKLGTTTVEDRVRENGDIPDSDEVDLAVRGGDGDDREKLLMDDYETIARDAERHPLRRGVTKADLYLQKHHGGPLGLPPP